MELSLKYSFGGTPAAPLVCGCVTVQASGAESIQEARLKRTDALLCELCGIFDAAFAVLQADAFVNTVALDVCAGAAFYAVHNIIGMCPTTAYGKMFMRVQALMRAHAEVVRVCGPAVGDAMLDVVMPAYKTLLRIDNCFADMPLT